MAVGMVLLSIPQLRRRDVTPGGLASLDRLVGRGGIAELVPPFPGLAAPAFATLMTGVGPAEHGLIGNVFYDRMTNRVEAGPFPDSVLQAPRLWDRLREIRPGARSLLWFAPNARDADVEFDAWAEADWSIHTGPLSLRTGLDS